MQKLKVLSGRSHRSFAEKICKKLNIHLSEIDYIQFDNDNFLAQIQENVRESDTFFIQTTFPPVQDGIVETLMVINALKQASAARITAVLPYFPYSRSDKKDQPRISITARLMADLLETAGANRVLTMDLHSPQIQGFFSTPCDQLIATSLICEHLKKTKDLSNYVLVAADVGKSKTLISYTKQLNLPLAIVDKRRMGNSGKVVPTHLIGDIKGKNALIVDDEISSGGTLCKAAQFLSDKGAKNPTYEEVCGKQTNHAEVVKVIFDEEVVSYNEILDFFFKIHDPTQLNRQGWDIGSQYRSIIFATDKAQLEVAEMTKKALEENSTFNKSIATQIEILPNYYKAEEYHQKYILKKMGQVPL